MINFERKTLPFKGRNKTKMPSHYNSLTLFQKYQLIEEHETAGVTAENWRQKLSSLPTWKTPEDILELIRGFNEVGSYKFSLWKTVTCL